MIVETTLELFEDQTGSDYWRTFNAWDSDDRLIATLYLRIGMGEPEDLKLTQEVSNE